MRSIGFNTLFLKSLVNDYTELGRYTRSADLYLFKGSVPSSFLDVPIPEIESSDEGLHANLAQASVGMVSCRLEVVKSGSNVRLNISKGHFSLSKERLTFFKPNPNTLVQVTSDISGGTAVNEVKPIGDCIVHNVSNFATANGSANTTTVPNLAEPTPLSIDDIINSRADTFRKNLLSGRAPGRDLDLSFGRTGFSNQSYRAQSRVSFHGDVPMDFVLMNFQTNTSRTNRGSTSSFDYVDNTGQLNSLGNFVPTTLPSPDQERLQLMPIPASLVARGLRIIPANATGNPVTNYYFTTLTAGLYDYASYPEYQDFSTGPYTWAILRICVNSDRNATSGRPALLLMTVGNEASSADLKIRNQGIILFTEDMVVENQTILELPDDI